MSLLYEFMQRIASAYNGKQIMEIKQLDLSGGQEFMCIQKERVGGFVHFYVRKINSEEIGCLGV